MTDSPKPALRLPSFLILILALLPLAGCAVAVGAGAGVGVAAVSERGIKTRAIDLKIEALILKEFHSHATDRPLSIHFRISDRGTPG